MENPQKAWETETEGFQPTRTEYRFVYAPKEIKTGFVCGTIFLLIALIAQAVIDHASFQVNEAFRSIIFFLFVSGPLLLVLSFYQQRLSITLDRKGITCKGFWFIRLPRYCEWSDFSQIRATTITWIRGWTGETVFRKLVFTHHSGNHYFLTVGGNKRARYVGVGHSLSLEAAVKRFVGSVETLSEEEKEKIPALAMSVNLGKEVKYITYAALWMALIAYAMLLIGQPLLLGDSIVGTLCWMAGLGAAIVVYRYLRSIRKRALMLVPALLFGGAVAFLLLPISSRLPLWLGKEVRVVFSISEENDKEQRWEAMTDAKKTFWVHARPDNRVFTGLGTEKVLTLYRGPGSLTVLPRKEYHALFRKAPKYKGKHSRQVKEE
ncbi:MAG: hypothetical protein FWC38_01260 [Proteobacteria bacterium]|nr:hypothetical protein [Pseudomonadota bacterium]MCL2306871.1 hypothetical protein [Pseudomonadota bacterium]